MASHQVRGIQGQRRESLQDELQAIENLIRSEEDVVRSFDMKGEGEEEVDRKRIQSTRVAFLFVFLVLVFTFPLSSPMPFLCFLLVSSITHASSHEKVLQELHSDYDQTQRLQELSARTRKVRCAGRSV